jgi:selenocysteine lyase/cysteine desulfurase
LLDSLFAYKVRPATDELPGRFETGTQNHEGLAGALGAVEYLAWAGETFGADYQEKYGERYNGRRLSLKKGMAAMRAYEYEISRAMLDILSEVPGLTLYGLSDPRRIEERVPTFAFRLKNQHPREVAQRLADKGIYVWDGNYYALGVTERLGLEDKGGMVRVGPVHYNTLEEIQRFGEVIREIAGRSS